MKKHILFHHVWHFIVLALFITNISYTQPVPGGDAPPISPGKHFLHIATAGNSASNWTVIDNPYTNGNADAKLFISHNWNGSGSGVYNDHVSGLWYNGSNWTIFNEDAGIVPVVENSAYHILVADESQSTVFQHSAEAGSRRRLWL